MPIRERKNSILKKSWIAALLTVTLTVGTPTRSYAFSDGSGWAIFPYIVKMVLEAYKRYAQLQQMITTAKEQREFFRVLNSGLDNLSGLISVMPIKDQKILENLQTFQDAVRKVETLYGSVPRSPESAVQLLHDQTVAESIRLMNDSKSYSTKQEQNAERIIAESRLASPKGAARITAQANAEILHTLNQLLKVNGQILKLQSEDLAMRNKQEKDSVKHFQRVQADVSDNSKNYQANFEFPRF